MNKLSSFLLAALAAGAVQTACAFNYHDGDLLLVFRGGTGANDVEYDLGSVSNYLGLAAGTQITVNTNTANFDTTVLSNNFNNQLNGVKFALFATTGLNDSWSRIWATDTSLLTAPKQMSISPWLNVRGNMSQVGIVAAQNSSSNSTPNYVAAAGSLSAYDFIAANGNPAVNDVSTWNGVLKFPTEGANPATLTFYQVEPGSGTCPLVGSFDIDVNGNLTFTAGMVISSSTIQQITYTNGTATVKFSTSLNAIHSLRYATSVNGPWTPLPGSVTGDGTVKTLTDTTTDPNRFYQIVTSTN